MGYGPFETPQIDLYKCTRVCDVHHFTLQFLVQNMRHVKLAESRLRTFKIFNYLKIDYLLAHNEISRLPENR